MIIAIAADHAGYPLKQTVIDTVRAAGHEAIDLGTSSEVSVDYPDYAEKVGQVILSGKAERGILVCGSGVGACMAANKMKGIYASVAHDTYSAAQGVEHDAMNVLCLGARIVGVEVARTLVQAFLGAKFSSQERHLRRVKKIHKIESNYLGD
ncbi:MAG: ribose 5-phosphate isomerase B [Anaerolineaceae bacterium]|nr:ribose 5-phosphate isomerase B [Anaerolineaceae bacterium]